MVTATKVEHDLLTWSIGIYSLHEWLSTLCPFDILPFRAEEQFRRNPQKVPVDKEDLLIVYPCPRERTVLSFIYVVCLRNYDANFIRCRCIFVQMNSEMVVGHDEGKKAAVHHAATSTRRGLC